jgi:phosphatidate cytidylyltransferase
MSHLDPYRRPGDWTEWPPREGPDDGDPEQYGRHRARHSAAAPEPSAPPAPQDGYRPEAAYPYPPEQDYPAPSTGSGWAGSGGNWDRSAGGWDRPGSGWEQPTLEHRPAPRYPGAEPFEIEDLLPGGGRTGRPRGRRRRGRSQHPVHNGAAVAGDIGRADTGKLDTGKPDTGKAPSGRAGRNLPAAIGVGLTLGAVVIAALFLWKPAFLGVITVAIGIAVWELTRAVRHSGAHPPLVPLLIGGVLMGGLAWYEGPDALSVGLLVTVLAAMIWRLADGPAGYQRDLTGATLVAVYVPFLGGFAALLAAPDDGAKRVIVTLAAVVLSDTGGYVAGVFFGQHPMAPAVSPKKSWEGLAGSLVAAAVGGALLLHFVFDVAPWWGAVFGLAISVASVLGDLAESMLKRDLGIKDMSSLLPGHGGLMDRLDSILFALPVAYLLLSGLVTPG